MFVIEVAVIFQNDDPKRKKVGGGYSDSDEYWTPEVNERLINEGKLFPVDVLQTYRRDIDDTKYQSPS